MVVLYVHQQIHVVFAKMDTVYSKEVALKIVLLVQSLKHQLLSALHVIIHVELVLSILANVLVANQMREHLSIIHVV